MNYIIGVIAGIGILMWIVGSIAIIRSDISRINVNLNKIIKHVGAFDTTDNEIKSLLAEGKKIEAIKKYRFVTGLGLKESKEYVDSLENHIK
jgi:ribosomal protein L7/L12